MYSNDFNKPKYVIFNFIDEFKMILNKGFKFTYVSTGIKKLV